VDTVAKVIIVEHIVCVKLSVMLARALAKVAAAFINHLVEG
jgi:hypothetical protein